jgi:hypothetical protein
MSGSASAIASALYGDRPKTALRMSVTYSLIIGLLASPDDQTGRNRCAEDDHRLQQERYVGPLIANAAANFRS